MPRLLSPEELQNEFATDYRPQTTERAGRGTLLGSAVDSAQATLYGVGEGFGLDLGRLRRENEYESNLERDRYYRDTGRPSRLSEVNGVGDFGSLVADVGVQSLPYLAGIGAAGLVGGPAGAFATGAAFGTGDVLQNQRDEAGRTNLATALPLGIAYGAADALTGVGGMVARRAAGTGLRTLDNVGVRALDELGGAWGAAARTGATAGKTFLAEGVGETFQEGANQLGRMSVNPDQTFFNEDANERYLDSFVLGGALGGVAGGALGGWRRSDGYTPRPVEDNTQRGLQTDLLNDGSVVQSVPTQDAIAQTLGLNRDRVGAGYPKDMLAAMDQPSGVRIADPITGVERELTMYEDLVRRSGTVLSDPPRPGEVQPSVPPLPPVAPQQTPAAVAPVSDPVVDPRAEETAAADTLLEKWGVKPSKARREIAAQVIAEQIDDDQQIATAVAQSKYGIARKAIEEAIKAREPAVIQQAPTEVAGIDPTTTVTIGRKGREETVTPVQLLDKIATASDKDKGRILMALGAEMTTDPTTGQPRIVITQEPRTLDQIAEAESAAAGKKVSRQGIQQSLKKFGITPEVINAVTGVSAQTVSQDELGINPEENGSGFRVETELSKATGQGLVDDGNTLTKEQRVAVEQADAILAQAGPGTAVGALDERPTNLPDGAVVTDMRDRNPEVTNENVRAILAHPLAETAALQWDHDSVSWDDMPDTFKADWVDDFVDNYRTNEGELNEQDLVRAENRIAEDFRRYSLGAAKVQQGRNLGRDGGAEAGRGDRPPNGQTVQGSRGGVGQTAAAKAAAQSVTPKLTPAQQAWDNLRGVYPMVPQWDTLSERQHKQIEDLVARDQFNLAAANTVAGGTTLVNKDVINDEPQIAVNQDVLGGNTLAAMGSGTRMEFDDVESYVGGIEDVASQFADAGIPNALSHVAEWEVFSDEADTALHGEITPEYGAYTVRLNVSKLENTEYAAQVARHEVGHAVDLAPHGGVYSAHPLMRAEVVSGKVVGRGAVLAEIIRYAGKNKGFAEFLEYPLDLSKYSDQIEKETPEQTHARIAQEVFAQVFTLFTEGAGTRKWFADNMPITTNFMKEVLADVKTAKRLQVYTAEIADRRAQAFENRVTSSGNPGGRAAAPGANQKGAGGQNLAARGSGQAAKLGPVGNDFIDKLPDGLRSLAVSTAYNAKKALTAVMFTRDLLTQAASVLPSAKAYLSSLDKAQVVKQKLERQAAGILDEYSKLSKAEKGTGPLSVNALIKASTSEKKWLFAPDWVQNVKVDENDADVRRFNTMSPEAQRVIKGVFKHGHDSLVSLQRAVIENTQSEFDGTIKALRDQGKEKEAAELEKTKAKSIAEFQELLSMRSGWPYAPLRRFGKFAVVGRSAEYRDAVASNDTKRIKQLESDSDHYYVQFAKSMGEADALRREAEQVFGEGNVDAFERTPDSASLFGGRDMLAALSKIRRSIEAEADLPMPEGTTKQMERVRNNMRQLVSQLYLSALSENSARKGELSRRDIAGADKDMMKAFASQAMATAHFTASLTNGAEMEKHLTDMRQEARNGGNRDLKMRYLNEVLRRRAIDLDYQETPLVDKAMAFTSTYLLTTNPSYFLLNATQPWMMSLPMIAGRHGFFKSAQMLTKSYGEVAKMLKNVKFDEADYTTLPADVRAAVEALADRGVINISLESEMGKFESETGTAAAMMESVNRKIRWATQSVESLNRVTTAIVAYRMERDAQLAEGKSKEQAHAAGIEFADKVIYETHGNYSGYNAPAFMRSGFGRLATQFRKFQLIQATMYARLLQQALKGATKEERAVAIKTLSLNLATLFAAAGTMGMPGFAAVAFILGALDDDEPDDPEATLRRAAESVGMSPWLTDVFTKGAFEALGLGTISGRIGAGNMLSLLPYTDIQMSRDGYADILMGFAGPLAGGVLPRMWDGAGLIAKGDVWKGMEMMAPSGVTNVLKAGRFAMEGDTKRNGDTLLASEDMSALTVAAQAVGLPTTTVTDKQFLSSAQFKADKFFKDKTAQIKREYADAVRDGDSQAMREAREAWQETQQTRKELGYKVQPLSELLKAPQERKKREADTVKGVQFRRTNEGFTRQLAEEM